MIVLMTTLLMGGLAADAPSLFEFLAARREIRHENVPRKVLAFYYSWYGTPKFGHGWTHWEHVDFAARDISAATHYPAIGPYDSHDPDLIDRHIDQAQGCGIDGFIATWWGRGDYTDEAFRVLLNRARRKNFEVTVYWERAPGAGHEQIRNAVGDLVYLLRTYGRQPAFLKVNGAPVIFVYGRVLHQVPQSAWPEIITRTRERVGLDFLLIADGYRSDWARMFDGVHTYNICGWVAGKSIDQIRDEARRRFTAAVALARGQGAISCITVIPGYDDTKIRTPGINAERHDGETYRALWEEAIAAGPDWVLITSWNEWHEGSEIEPSLEYGARYLRLTAAATRRFRTSPRIQSPVEIVGMSSQQRAELAQLYRDKRIGLLPGYGGDLALLLGDCGVPVVELTIEDVLDPEVLNPIRLPILIYAAHERYIQSVHEPGDVDQALQRYLAAGGLMIVAPHGPYPFYYNEKGQPVQSAARFGLPIVASNQEVAGPGGALGWERPPEVPELVFSFDTQQLPGLPETAPFPDSGDLRWRPTCRALAADAEVYLPLASLHDIKGREYGDGIAYIEHGGPNASRILYAWMRMGDVAGSADLYFALLRFAAQHSQ